MARDGTEERILGALNCLSVHLVPRMIVNWVPSCYFGNLSFNVSCHHLRSEHRIFLSLLNMRAPCKDEGQCCFENNLGNSKLS